MGEEAGQTDWKKLQIPRHAPRANRETAEDKYWRHFGKPVLHQQERSNPACSGQKLTHEQPSASQAGAVTSVDIAPRHPFDVAATASTRVHIYDSNTGRVRRQISRFKDTAYSGVFRSDGRLLAAGGEDGIVQVFDAHSRMLLRRLKGHKQPAHVVRFAPDRMHVLSGGDDATVRWWDVTQGQQLFRLDGHSDYVRCAAVKSESSDTWATGGYDHACRLWDMRSKQVDSARQADALTTAAAQRSANSESVIDSALQLSSCTPACVVPALHAGAGAAAITTDTVPIVANSGCASAMCVLSVDHGSPVEDVAFFPSGSLAVTAGGNSLCIWDMVAGGRLLQRLSNHQKTVTCVRLSPLAGPESSAAPRMLAGALDGYLKVYELDTFQVVHVHKYPGPVLSMALSKDCSVLAVGQADGLLSIRKHSRPKQLAISEGGRPVKRQKYRPQPTAASYRYFSRGQGEKPAAGDLHVRRRKRANLKPYDLRLKRFEFREALDETLLLGRPEVVAAMCEELVLRHGLNAAVGQRDSAALEPLLQFVSKHIIDPRYAQTIVLLAHTIVNIYAVAVGSSASIDRRLTLLRERVMLELRLQSELRQLQGMLAPLLQAGTPVEIEQDTLDLE